MMYGERRSSDDGITVEDLSISMPWTSMSLLRARRVLTGESLVPARGDDLPSPYSSDGAH